MIVNLNDKSSMKAVSNIDKKLMKGITSGCFDMFHYYHVVYLERCKRQCDVLIVGVDSDRMVKETKGDDRPVINEYHRLEMINQCRYVDICFIMDDLKDWEDMIFRSKSFKVFKNEQFAPEAVKKATGNLIIIPDIEELTSTSEVIKKIQEKGNDG